jgi:imidazolonepropionase
MNTACALELAASHGSITRKKVANVFVSKPMPSVSYLPYAFGSFLVDRVILNGNLL